MSKNSKSEIERKTRGKKQHFAILRSREAAAHYSGAQQFFNNGEYSKALAETQKGMAIEEHPSIHRYLAVCYSECGDDDKAIEEYRKAIEYDPGYVEGYSCLGIICSQRGNFEEAIKLLTKAIDLGPYHVDAYYNLGTVYDQMAMFDKAIECYNKVLAIHRDDTDAWYNLAEDYLNKYMETKKLEFIDNAIECFEECLKLDSTQQDARDGLRKCEMIKKQYMSDSVQRDAQPVTGNPDIGDVILGNYEIMDIKKGGMGTVYIALNKRDQTMRAIKTFQGDFVKREIPFERFVTEAKTWVKLGSHPNIVEAVNVEELHGKPYVILEYVEGGSLRERFQEKRMSVEDVLKLSLQFCAGMVYAYGKLELVHRDIKPENILIAGNGDFKITDFGLAKAFESALAEDPKSTEFLMSLTSSGTQTGMVFGTLPYMSPEQFKDSKSVDTRSDIYSFGVVLFEAMCGRPYEIPLEYKDAIYDLKVHLYRKMHCGQPVPDPREKEPNCPESLAALIRKCLAKGPDERYGSFLQLEGALKQICQNVTGELYHTKSEQRDKQPNYFNIYLRKGESFYHLGKFLEALEYFNKAEEINPEHPRLLLDLGNCLGNLCMYDDAIDCYDTILASDPENDKALTSKSHCLLNQQKYNEALKCLDKAAKLNPGNNQVWVNRGAVLLKMGKKEEALDSFDKAIKINLRDEKAWVNKGAVLADLGQIEEALRCCEKALAISPGDPGTWNNKGKCLWDMGRKAESIACLEKALQIDPSHYEAMQNLRMYRGSELSSNELQYKKGKV